MERPAITWTSTVLDSPDPPRLAAFYERMLGYERGSDEPDWITLGPPGGGHRMSIQREGRHVRPVWPAGPGDPQMQLHLDVRVEDLDAAVAWALDGGATQAEFQPQQDVRVMLDPDGHPFCLFVE